MTERDFAAYVIEFLGSLRKSVSGMLALRHSSHYDTYVAVIGDLTMAKERLERLIQEEERDDTD